VNFAHQIAAPERLEPGVGLLFTCHVGWILYLINIRSRSTNHITGALAVLEGELNFVPENACFSGNLYNKLNLRDLAEEEKKLSSFAKVEQ
jgi:hypothetical protein